MFRIHYENKGEEWGIKFGFRIFFHFAINMNKHEWKWMLRISDQIQ